MDFFLRRLQELRIALRYTSESRSGYGLPEINEEWLGGADLVRIERRDVTQFSRSFTTEGFVMEPPRRTRPTP